jgi:hypothetical protein
MVRRIVCVPWIFAVGLSPVVSTPAAVADPVPISCAATEYQNVDGVCVPRPEPPPTGGVPAGATARCRDGDYSFSRHRTGTCSGHGGVAEWLTHQP